MERRQQLIQRTREYFGERLDQVLQMVQQDRQELHGWEEPGHLRAVLRRTIREGGSSAAQAGALTVAEMPLRGAAEPDKGQQREALGQVLEAGAAALEKMSSSQSPELTAEQLLGLECVALLYGRPALQISDGRLGQAPGFWNIIEDQRDDIELTQRGIGRIALVGHPEYDWAGTGFLVGPTCLMTTRSIVQLFAEPLEGGAWQFRPGISAWMDYAGEYQRQGSAAYRIRGVHGVHERYDLALLDVEPPQANGAPAPLALALEAPQQLEGRPVYLLSYPVRDARRSEPESIARIFRDVYNVKRVQPGTLRGIMPFRDIHLLRHDCAPLGQSAGGCLIDLETHRVLGLHLAGRYLETGTAVPLWMLRDDPLLKRCQVAYAGANAQEVTAVTSQIERLARSHLWDDARTAIAGLYQRAFGSSPEMGR